MAGYICIYERNQTLTTGEGEVFFARAAAHRDTIISAVPLCAPRLRETSDILKTKYVPDKRNRVGRLPTPYIGPTHLRLT